MKSKLAIFIIISIIAPALAFAEVNTKCSSNGYTVVTINGMLTSNDRARDNMIALSKNFGYSYNKQKINYEYFLNPSHLAGFNDYIDVVQQGLFDQASDYDLVEMINDASKKVKTQKILLVAHSQGNFYANNFYDKTASMAGGVPKKSIGIYGIASPANRVAGGGKYLTSDTDNVIAAVVGRYIKILSPNVHISLDAGADGNGHSFSGVYLKYESNRIVSDIKSALNKLKENDEQLPEDPCISPPELSLAHKVQGAVLAVADPAAVAVKAGAVASYNAGAYVRDGAANTGKAVGKILNKTVLAVKNTVKGLSANVAGSLPDAGSLTTGITGLENSEEKNSTTEPEKTEPAAADTGETTTPPADENGDQTQNPPSEIPEENEDYKKRGSGGGSDGAIPEEVDKLPEDPIVPPVIVPDTTAPVVSVTGENPTQIIAGATYSDAGATATDDVDASVEVITTGLVDNLIVGAYTITYTAKDISNNVGTAYRTVNVIEKEPEPIPEPEPDDTGLSSSDLNVNDIEDRNENEVIVNSNQSLPAGEYRFKNLIISDNATLTLLGDELSVNSFKGVKIRANNITVNSGSYISADKQGYRDGPGAPTTDFGGATHKYGSATRPTDLGSGGTSNTHGGGAIRLVIENAIENNGVVSANGDNNSSGGSIYLSTKDIRGSGKFSANGGIFFLGSNIHAPGEGGRMAFYYETSTFSGKAEAKGGCGSYDGFSSTCALNGTVGFFDVVNNNLLVDSSWQFLAQDSPMIFNDIFITKGAKLSTESGSDFSANNISINEASVFTLSGEETIDAQSLILSGSSLITILPEKILYLKISNISIEAGSKISADGKGYVLGSGSPDEWNTAGASHGGKGGGALAKQPYGSEEAPVDFGSGSQSSRPGGGAVRIIASETFQNDGIVSASAIRAVASASSTEVHSERASGGSIYITTDKLSGNGIFKADGGGTSWPYEGLAGGGGRIAIHYALSSFSGQALVSGANSGTVKLIDTSVPEPDPDPDPTPDPEPEPLPDTVSPQITNYTFNGTEGNINVNPITNPVALSFTASENVNWMSIKIENKGDASLYKIFQSGAGCVDGTKTCIKTWNGILSSGGLLTDGTFRIKMHIKDEAGNEFYDYLPNEISVEVP